MNNTPFPNLCAAATLTALALLLSSCSSTQNSGYNPPRQTVQLVQAPQQPLIIPQVTNPLDLPGKDQPGYVNPYPAGSYEHFVAQAGYPKIMDVYSNDQILSQITASNSKIIICIPQQRARVYVNGKVGLDWPVSTGTNGHETPTGVFRVMEKNENHHSNRYGKFVNASGKTVNGNADTADGVPEGLTFTPAPMPNWHRLTWDGVGIHTGKVIPGRRLSHGCIRSPHSAAQKLFKYSVMGMPAYITRAVEDYNRGGFVRPIDVKYRPIPGNDYTDLKQPVKTIPAGTTASASASTPSA